MGKVNAKVERVRDRILYPNIRNVNEKKPSPDAKEILSTSSPSLTEMSERRKEVITLESLSIQDPKKGKKEINDDPTEDDASTASTHSKSESEGEV